MEKKEVNYKQLCFLLLCFFTYLLWMVVIPYNKCPDEYMRMDLVNFMLKHGTLPNGYDPSIRNQIWGFSYAFMPFVAQMIAAAFAKTFLIFKFPASLIYLGARFPSVLFATATAYFCMKIADRLFTTKYKWIFTVTLCFLPQVVFLSMYVNNESFAILGASATVYCWVCGEKDGWNVKNSVKLAIALSICILSYYNVYGFVLFSIPFFVISFINWQRRQTAEGAALSRKKAVVLLIQRVILIAFICLAIAGWFFIRNYILYGDALGLKAARQSCEQYAQAQYKPSARTHPESLSYMLFDMGWLKYTAETFIGCFGYCEIALSKLLYSIYLAIACIGLLGNGFFFVNRKERKGGWLLPTTISLAAVTALILSIYNSLTSDYQPQGRYAIYLIIPLSLFIARGYESLSAMIIKNQKVRGALVTLYGAAYVLMSYFVFFKYIVASYIRV
jgi:hypothetical protein